MWGGGGRFGGKEGSGGCERRIEVFVKIEKIKLGGGGVSGRGGGVGLVGGGGLGRGVRVIVTREVKFL